MEGVVERRLQQSGPAQDGRQEACSESLSHLTPSLWDMAGSLPSGADCAHVAAQILPPVLPRSPRAAGPLRWPAGQPIQSAASSAK